MKILYTLTMAMAMTVNSHAATYLLLTQTNALAAGITNSARTYSQTNAAGWSVVNGTNVAANPISAPSATVTGTVSAGSVAGNVVNAINVTASPYNAAIDGLSDAQPAIQAAVNACPAFGTVCFPAGVFRLNSTVVVTNPINVVGCGSSIIQYHGGDYAFRIGQTNIALGYTYRFSIAGMAFNCQNGSAGDIYIEPYNADVEIWNSRFSTTGDSTNHIDIVGAGNNWFLAVHDCFFSHAGSGTALYAGVATPLKFVNNTMTGNSTAPGLQLLGSASRVLGNVIEAYTPVVLLSGAALHSVDISHNYMEGYLSEPVIAIDGTIIKAVVKENYCNLNQPGYTNNFIGPYTASTTNLLVGADISGNAVAGMTNLLIRLTAGAGQFGNRANGNAVLVSGTMVTNWVVSNHPEFFYAYDGGAGTTNNALHSAANYSTLGAGFYGFNGDLNTGWYAVAGSEIGAKVGNYGMFRMNSNGLRLGNLGTAAETLDIIGNGIFSGYLRLGNTTNRLSCTGNDLFWNGTKINP